MNRTLARVTYRKSVGFLLLFLFCSYFGSVTFFHHTHIIDGITVVHSHPYKSQSGEDPVKHKHSKSGFLLIQFISDLVTTAPILFIGITIIQISPGILLRDQDNPVISNLNLIRACRPRAPTF